MPKSSERELALARICATRTVAVAAFPMRFREVASPYGMACAEESDAAIASWRAVVTTVVNEGRLRRLNGEPVFQDAPSPPAESPDVLSPR